MSFNMNVQPSCIIIRKIRRRRRNKKIGTNNNKKERNKIKINEIRRKRKIKIIKYE